MMIGTGAFHAHHQELKQRIDGAERYQDDDGDQKADEKFSAGAKIFQRVVQQFRVLLDILANPGFCPEPAYPQGDDRQKKITCEQPEQPLAGAVEIHRPSLSQIGSSMCCIQSHRLRRR